MGCIYRHPSMDLTEFNEIYLSDLLEKLTKENKTVFLLGDFNINLINYNSHNPTSNFVDSLASNSFIPYILQPTRVTTHSKTLIDNIFTNLISDDVISGNITSTISDHLPQFLIAPNIFGNQTSIKSNIYERDWSHFIQQEFVLDYFAIDWPNVLKISSENVDLSLEIFLEKII